MKKFEKILIYFLLVSFLAATAALLAPSAAAAPVIEIDAGAAALVDMDTGAVLYGLNAEERMYPASLTKIMTALVALDAFQNGEVAMSDIVTVSANIYDGITSDSSSLNLVEGERMTFENLLYCVIMTSANEPCNALAEYVSGSVSAFVEEMNNMAASLGCTNTHFVNTHGLPNLNHFTTAHDMAIILKKAMSIPQFSRMTGTVDYTLPATNKSDVRQLRNTNNLLVESSVYYYEYAKGGKTGYTDAAGYCLASVAQKGDVSLIAILLKTKSGVVADGTTQIKSFTEARRLFRWGFENFSYRTVLSTLQLVKEVPVKLGDGADSVGLRPENAIVLLIDNEADLNAVKLDIMLDEGEDGTLQAPIAAGEKLGEAEVTLNGISYGMVNLVANYTVDLDRAKFITSEIKAALDNTYVKLVIVFVIILFIAYIAFIIIYNLNRRRKQKIQDMLARQRIEAIRAEEELTTGMSFEEIEEKQAERERYRRR